MGKQAVTLTFLGNSRDLERSIDRVDSKLATLESVGKKTLIGGLAVGALAVAGPLGAATAALGAFGAVAAPELKKGSKGATELESSFKSLQKSMKPFVDTVINLGAKTLKDALPALRVLATAGGHVLESFLKPLDRFVQSKVFSNLIDQFAKFAVQAGNLLGPQMVKLLGVLLQLFVQVMPSGMQILNALIPSIVQLAQSLTPVLVTLTKIVAPTIAWLTKTGLLIPLILTIISIVKIWVTVTKAWIAVQTIVNFLLSANPIGIIILAIVGLIAVIVIVVKHWQFFREVATVAWRTVKHEGEVVWNWIRALPGRIASVFSVIGRAISSPFVSAFNLIRTAWNSTVGGKGFSIPSWVPVIGGDSFHIPYFHTGGIVGGSGDTLAMLKGGEGVFTREQMAAMGGAGGGGKVVIEFTGGQDEFITWLKKSVRIRGGDPSVLGA